MEPYKSIIQNELNKIPALKSAKSYSEMQENALAIEFRQEANKLLALIDWAEKTNNPIDTFKESFRSLCAAREKANANTLLSFSANPTSPCNALYWKLAHSLFKPATFQSMCQIVLPSLKQELQLVVTYQKTNIAP